MLSDADREALAARLRRGPGADAAGGVTRRPGGMASLPLSCGQEQLWFLDQFAPGQAAYNVPLALRLSGPLDQGGLERAIDALAARHEALRTRLVAGDDGRPVQVIDPPGRSALALADLSGGAPEKTLPRLREFIAAESVRPFSLAAGPLLRTWLLRLATGEHVLLVVVHHTVFDGWSAGVMLRDLAALYRQEARGEPSGLAELPVQFGDFAVWERQRLQGPVLAGLEEYWRGVLDGFETVRFPADRPRPAVDSFEGGLAERMTGGRLLEGLQELSRREGTTLFVTLLAALVALLHRYTGQDDLVVGTVSAHRDRAELAPLIGFLVSTLPIRADASGDPAFTRLLARVKSASLDAFSHQDLPFGRLVQALGVERDASRAPVFQIALTYAERDSAPVPAGGVDFALTNLVVGTEAAKFDLTFTTEARPGGLWIECSYKSALFDAASIERLLGHFEVLLAGVVAEPGARLSELPVLTAAELGRELGEWNDTAAGFPVCCVHEGFEAQVTRTPDAVAAQYEDEQWSYAELNAWANRVARRLRGLGVGPEVLVGVCMRPGLPRLAALLGIWKAGGGYVPLDPALPAGRLSFMIADAGLAVVLAGDSTLPALPESSADLVSLEAEWAAIGALDDAGLADAPASPASPASPANAAYVIYTSGSTGQPKGVVVEHRQAVSYLYGMASWCGMTASDAMPQLASLSFDASVMNMFMPLLAGGRVLLAPAETLHSPPRLAALIRDRHATVAFLTPAVLGLLAGEQFPDLRLLMCGGEEVPSELASQWIRPGRRFANVYGPTETTIIATGQELTAAAAAAPPIGRPLPNYRAYVLDGRLNPVPVGVTGELHIGGAGVARGYLGRPELTRQRFIPDPFTPGQRLYKTGDLARRRPDGSIVFAGRADGQVKIRGLRIELGEIEAALAAHPAIAQAVVTVTDGPSGDQQLTAYLRPEPGAGPEPGPAGLRAHLAATLPGYMIPAHLITVTSFPLSTSGKIDRSALPPPASVPAARGPAGGHVAPAGLIETVLADLYATVLSTDQVGATDNFFDIGGSSVQAMRLVSLMDSELEVDVGGAAVFLAPTPRQLAALLRDEHGFDDADLGPGDAAGLPSQASVM